MDALDVHHKTYERIGAEKPGDLVVLCRACHGQEHEKQRRVWADDRYDRAMDTYATKKYGEHWDDDQERITEEFDEWLEGKQGW